MLKIKQIAAYSFVAILITLFLLFQVMMWPFLVIGMSIIAIFVFIVACIRWFDTKEFKL